MKMKLITKLVSLSVILFGLSYGHAAIASTAVRGNHKVSNSKSLGSTKTKKTTSTNKKKSSPSWDVSGHDESGHEYVDLGLPSGTLWATSSIGAKYPWDKGLYFAWGETKGYPRNDKVAKSKKRNFEWKDYKWRGDREDTYSKYVVDPACGKVDNLVTLCPDDDAATANWGLGWEMPSNDQFLELFKYTEEKQIWINGSYETKLISKVNGKSIIFPTTGFNGWGYYEECGTFYWSSNLDIESRNYALGMFWSGMDAGGDRYKGMCVRPVRKQSK